MDSDERWVMKEMDLQDDLVTQLTYKETSDDVIEDEIPWRPRWTNHPVTELPDFPQIWYFATSRPTPVKKVQNGRPVLRRRELHSCHRTAWQRSLRADRSYAISERQRLVGFVLDQDGREQLNDYFADQVTDVPSVGVSSYISYFGRNVGEYSLAEYERGDYADDNEEDEAYEPAWRKYGFNSEAEYQDYLDECGSVYDDDVYEPSYAEARSELYADTSLDQLETA